MNAKDSLRKWIWWFLGGIVALQFYFVRELLAAFALFALGFIVIGLCLAALYFVQKGWEAGVGRCGGQPECVDPGGAARGGDSGRVGPAANPASGFGACSLILFGLFCVSQSTEAGITVGVG